MLSPMLSSLGIALLGALWAAALSTFGDWVWARYIPRTARPTASRTGRCSSWASARSSESCAGAPLRGALLGAAVGFGAAAGSTLSRPLVGYAAMFVLWMALWAALAVADARGLVAADAPLRPALGRGGLAAIASGLAFYAISGIWTAHRAGRTRLPLQLPCWTIAFLPGFVALLFPPLNAAGFVLTDAAYYQP